VHAFDSRTPLVVEYPPDDSTAPQLYFVDDDGGAGANALVPIVPAHIAARLALFELISRVADDAGRLSLTGLRSDVTSARSWFSIGRSMQSSGFGVGRSRPTSSTEWTSWRDRSRTRSAPRRHPALGPLRRSVVYSPTPQAPKLQARAE